MGTKTEKLLVFFAKTENQMLKTKNPQTALNTKTEKPKSFDIKTEKPIKKISKTAKSKIPMPPSLRDFVPRVSHLTTLWSAPGGGKMRDPGNEVGDYVLYSFICC